MDDILLMREEIERFNKITNALSELALRAKFTIFLDENLYQLKDALKDYGFKVLMMDKGKTDEEIMDMAEGWAILTKNSKDFVSDAVKYDYDVISIENIKYIDNESTRKNQTVQKIAKALQKSLLPSLKGNFLLTVMDDGKWTLKGLQ